MNSTMTKIFLLCLCIVFVAFSISCRNNSPKGTKEETEIETERFTIILDTEPVTENAAIETENSTVLSSETNQYYEPVTDPETEYLEPPKPELETDPPLCDTLLTEYPTLAFDVYRNDSSIRVDGNLSDWGETPKQYLIYNQCDTDNPHDIYVSCDGYIMMTWDEEKAGIYLALFVPDLTHDTDASSLRDWFSLSYHFGEKDGKLDGQYIVCTINCDSWHPGLTNYDVNESGSSTGLVIDGTTQMVFSYVPDGVVVETYMPLSESCKSLLHAGAQMNVAVRYDDGRYTDYTSEVKRRQYLFGDNDHSFYNDISQFATVTFSEMYVKDAVSKRVSSEDAYDALGTLSAIGLLRKKEYGFRTRLNDTPTYREAIEAASKLFMTDSLLLETALQPFNISATDNDTITVSDWIKILLCGLGYRESAAATQQPIAYARGLLLLDESFTAENETLTFTYLFLLAENALQIRTSTGQTLIEWLVSNHFVNTSSAIAAGVYIRYLESGYMTYSSSYSQSYEPILVPGGIALITPEDFGAVGDGVHDDGPAIESAFRWMQSMGDQPCVLRFGRNKTYKVSSYEQNQYLIHITNKSNIYVDGKGSEIVLTYPVLPMWIESCTDIQVFDLSFEYAPAPFIEGTITRVDITSGCITFTTDTEMNLAIGETWETADSVFFALPNLEYTRGFINIYKYKRIDENTYRAWSHDLSVAGCSKKWIFPNPGAAHLGSSTEAASYHIFYSDNVSLSNIRIYSNIYFTFSVSGNIGPINFTNVVLKPREDASVQLITSWRDGFHCKENRGPITWKNCYIGNLGDDAFNICTTLQKITDMKTTADGTVYTLSGVEQYCTGIIQAGDVFDAYNILTGDYIGRGTVKKVISQELKQITVAEKISGLDMTEGVRLAFISLAAPGSEIINCTVKGTVRFKGPITIKDSTFDILEMWEMVEGDIEGPIPYDVKFMNCTFVHGMITCDAVNRQTGKMFEKIAAQIKITFTDCTFEKEASVTSLHGARAITITNTD